MIFSSILFHVLSFPLLALKIDINTYDVKNIRAGATRSLTICFLKGSEKWNRDDLIFLFFILFFFLQ